MAEIENGSMTACDVIEDIIRANSEIDAISAVIYTESENWVDQIGDLHLTTSTVKNAMRQDSGQRKFFDISRSCLLGGELHKLQKQLGVDALLGVTSKVRTNQQTQMHIPMMDFRCPISEDNLRALVELLPESGQKDGFILESGRSYHYYGKALLSHDAWIAFLGKCLLMKNFVDDRYVGHQLVDGHCVLRISTSARRPIRPTLAHILKCVR